MARKKKSALEDFPLYYEELTPSSKRKPEPAKPKPKKAKKKRKQRKKINLIKIFKEM